MIVSASYRTDIPAFYGDWFAARRAAGSCTVKNPYGGAPYRVALRGPAVDGFVFWTRNARPFLPVLDALTGDGVPFVVQYTVTEYPALLETGVPAATQAVACAREIAARFGPDALVWRYDPILVTSATPLETHRDRFARLADALAGATNQVVVSFADFYRKTVRNLGAGAPTLTWRDPTAGEKTTVLADLRDAAQARGMLLPCAPNPTSRRPASPPRGASMRRDYRKSLAARSQPAQRATERAAPAPKVAISAPTILARMGVFIATPCATMRRRAPHSAAMTISRTPWA